MHTFPKKYLHLSNGFSRALLVNILNGGFAFLFVYAGISKLLDADHFRTQLGQSPLLTSFADQTVWLVPISELTIAIFLFVPRMRLLALYGFFSMMVLFTAYIIFILNFSDYIPCSCGGILEKMGWKQHLIFNLLFVIVAAATIVVESNQTEKSR